MHAHNTSHRCDKCLYDTRARDCFLQTLSGAVFTGTIISANFLHELQIGALCSGLIHVECIEKSQPDLKTNVVVYFEQTYSVQDDKESNPHGRICPGSRTFR